MANYTLVSLKDEYTTEWAMMEVKRVGPATQAAQKIIKGKDIYLSIQNKTGVPWYFIGLLHLRESDCDFQTHLHNGDSLNAKTYHVPAGRPLKGTPPFSFEYSAIDAIEQKGFQKIKLWTIEQMAYSLELYNGWGYRNKGTPSAYLWAGSNQYTSGKYIRDHVFDPNAIDTQLGCMPVLFQIFKLTGEKAAIDRIITDTKSPKAEIPVPTNKEMNKVSRKYFWTDWLHWIGIGGTTTTSVYKVVQNLDIEATKTVVDTTSQIATLIGATGLIVLFIGIIIYSMHMKSLMKKDVVDGRSAPSGEETTQETILSDDNQEKV